MTNIVSNLRLQRIRDVLIGRKVQVDQLSEGKRRLEQVVDSLTARIRIYKAITSGFDVEEHLPDEGVKVLVRGRFGEFAIASRFYNEATGSWCWNIQAPTDLGGVFHWWSLPNVTHLKVERK